MVRRMVLCVLVLLGLSATVVSAQEVTVTSKVTPVYLGVDGARFYDGPVSQTDVLVSWNGVYADLWTSTAANTRKGYDKEIDVTLGYGFTARGVNYGVETLYFVSKGIDVLNLNLEVSLSGEELSPFLRAEFYAPRKSGGPAKGTLLSGGVRSKLVVASCPLSLEASVKQDSGAF